MAKHDAQFRAKAARNDVNALRYPRRSPADRKQMRHERALERERLWLVAHAIPIEPVARLAPARRRKRGRR